MGDLHCDLGFDESLALMKGWIDDCRRCHQLCKVPQQVGGPKRLLKCLSDGSVRLEAQSPTQRRDYIALSYCWGDGTAVMKTTKDTVDSHRFKIPNESLPLLYREVVALARQLNIPYLWIDSLCIIQGSPEDKDEEMMQMSDIFRGAFVAVVAAMTPSPSNPLLGVKPQDQSYTTWRTASLISYQEMDLDVKFRKRLFLSAHCSTNATDHTHTGARAWCFQEKLLARHCLVFRYDEMVWECRTGCKCECGGEQEHLSDGNTSVIFSDAMKRYRQMLLSLAEHDPFQPDGTLKYFADAEAAYSFWETTVNKYSVGAMTFRTDRLPAILAVASIVAEATEGCYLAGLWEDNLLAGLGWITLWSPHPRHARPHQQEYIAPTWSWASQSYEVFYRPYRTRPSRDADLDASVDCAWAVLEGQNPYGPVSDGSPLCFPGSTATPS